MYVDKYVYIYYIYIQAHHDIRMCKGSKQKKQ